MQLLKKSVAVYQLKRHHIPKDFGRDKHCCENVMSSKEIIFALMAMLLLTSF